jgi:hypothetical protein
MQRRLGWGERADLSRRNLKHGFPNQETIPQAASLGDSKGGLGNPSSATQPSAGVSAPTHQPSGSRFYGQYARGGASSCSGIIP